MVAPRRGRSGCTCNVCGAVVHEDDLLWCLCSREGGYVGADAYNMDRAADVVRDIEQRPGVIEKLQQEIHSQLEQVQGE
jgi:hypothetical protein